MFVIFLPALNFRGNRSPYLWWFHKFLNDFGKQAIYVCGDEYFNDPEQLLAAGRTEASAAIAELYNYHLPDSITLANQSRIDIPLEKWQALEALFPTNPMAVFQHYCTQVDMGFCTEIETVIDRICAQSGVPEAIITCVNCASLQRVCSGRNLSLLHIELGPLRPPNFLKTAYFDFSGVNGKTEAARRFESDTTPSEALVDWHSIDQLRSLFMLRRMPTCLHQDVERGLALQIEDDSNIICFSNGHSALSLINSARQALTGKNIPPPVLVRSHPGSFFSLRSLPSGLDVDHSMSSIDFIIRCKDIHTINSGLAVESMMLGRKVHILGESPFSFCTNAINNECNVDAFSFFLVNYLVPWNLAFKPEYIRWRLRNPNESSIRQMHLEGFMQEKIRLLEARITELEQCLVESDNRWAQLKSSLPWRLSHPLWKILRWCQRFIGRIS